MNEPKNYAQIEAGTVVNIMWIKPENINEFPNLVCCDGLSVSIGDSYDGVNFIPQPVEEPIIDENFTF